MELTVSYLTNLTSKFLSIENIETRKEAFALVSVSCLTSLPSAFTDKFLSNQPKLRKKLDTLRLNPRLEDQIINTIVRTVSETYKTNSEIIPPALDLFAVLLQTNVTSKFFRGLLDFHRFPISEFSDLQNLSNIDGFSALSRFVGKFPITAPKISVFQLFMEISEISNPQIIDEFLVESCVNFGTVNNRKLVDFRCDNFRLHAGQWTLVDGVPARVISREGDSLKTEFSKTCQISDRPTVSVLGAESQATVARIAIADEILAKRNFRLNPEIAEPLLGLVANDEGKIKLGQIEDIGNFLNGLPGRVFFVSTKANDALAVDENVLILRHNEGTILAKFEAERKAALLAAKQLAITKGRPDLAAEIPYSCQIASHALVSEFSEIELAKAVDNFRWLELVKEPTRRVDALIGKFAKVVAVEADKFPLEFARIQEIKPWFDTVVLEASEFEMDVALAASLPGVKEVWLINGGATSERMKRLGTS